MLRESSVTYSSLPQEEEINAQTTVEDTRKVVNPHTKRDCCLTATITTLIIISGICVAVILPLALKHRSEARGRGDLSQQLTAELVSNNSSTHQQGSSSNITDTKQRESSSNLTDIQGSFNKTDNSGVASLGANNTKEDAASSDKTSIHKSTESTTTTTTTTTTITTTPITTTTTTTTATTATTPTTTTILIKTTVPSGVSDNLALPQQSGGKASEENKVMGRHDPATLVVIAVLVAVSCAAVLIAMSWLVFNRITAHRRRINIQNVITDLQSRDKIVLLNSESEED
ncbi:hypothetical protein OTU49_015114 [Cherax quadricarinatus]|uniref:Uncharacterized protein n=1 Tax=Cherax quadricarinatus TaxID=27406 RepID=A0AAW0XZD1_CHEQU